MTPEKLAYRLAAALDARDRANKAMRRAWNDTDSDDDASQKQLVRWRRQSATAETELHILLEIIKDHMVEMRRERANLDPKSVKAKRMSGELARLELLLECESPREVYRLFPLMDKQKPASSGRIIPNPISQAIDLIVSMVIVVSVWLPWLPLRGLDRVNLPELAAGLSRVGIARWIWIVPIVIGAVGAVASLVPRRTIRGPLIAVMASVAAVYTVSVTGEFISAMRAVTIMPLVPSVAGPGVLAYLLGLIGMLGAGCFECIQFRRGRWIAAGCVGCLVVISVMSPTLRTPRPIVSIQSWGDRSGETPVRHVTVKVQNRGWSPMRMVDSIPEKPSPSTYRISLYRIMDDTARAVPVSLETFMADEPDYPVIVPEKGDVEFKFEFRPVWTKVPKNTGIDMFNVSAAGRYKFTIENSFHHTVSETVFDVKPVEHIETDAAMLLAEVRGLVDSGEYARAETLAHRIIDAYPTTKAAETVAGITAYIEVGASLDQQLATIKNSIKEADKARATGDFGRAKDLLDQNIDKVDKLLEVVPDESRLTELRARMAARRVQVETDRRREQANDIAARMKSLADRGAISAAADLARILKDKFADTSAYTEFQTDINTLLRKQAIAGKFNLMSIGSAAGVIMARLQNVNSGKQVTVKIGDRLENQITVVRIDKRHGTVELEQAGTTVLISMGSHAKPDQTVPTAQQEMKNGSP